jgi:hypothetical protein
VHPPAHAEDAHTEEGHAGSAHGEGAEHEPTTRNEISFSGLLNFTKLSGTLNGTTNLPSYVSNPQPGFELGYERELSASWSVGVNYAFINTSFPDSPTNPFNELSTVLHEFSVSFGYHLTHTSTLHLSAGMAQVDDLTLNPADNTVILIDHTFRGTLGFQFTQELARFYGAELLGSLGGLLFIPTDFSRMSLMKCVAWSASCGTLKSRGCRVK